MGCGIDSTGHGCRADGGKDQDQFSGENSPGHSAGNHGIGLRDVSMAGSSLAGRSHFDLVLSLNFIWPKTARDRAPVLIGDESGGASALSEAGTGPVLGQFKEDRRAGNRLVVFVLHLHDGLAGSALLDVIDGPIALNDHDVERCIICRWRWQSDRLESEDRC